MVIIMNNQKKSIIIIVWIIGIFILWFLTDSNIAFITKDSYATGFIYTIQHFIRNLFYRSYIF